MPWQIPEVDWQETQLSVIFNCIREKNAASLVSDSFGASWSSRETARTSHIFLAIDGSRFFFAFLVALVMFSPLASRSFVFQDYKPKHSMVRVNSLNCYVATPAQSTTKGVIMSLPQLKLVGWWKSMQPWKKHLGSVLLILQPNIFFWMVWIPKENIVNTYSYTACTTVYICNYAHIMTGIMNMKAHWIKPCNALRYHTPTYKHMTHM